MAEVWVMSSYELHNRRSILELHRNISLHQCVHTSSGSSTALRVDVEGSLLGGKASSNTVNPRIITQNGY